MGADDLLRQNSFHPNHEEEHQNLGSEADLYERAWQRNQGLEAAGADQDLRRSEEALALSELLQANGLQKGNIDALLQGDTYEDLLRDATNNLSPEPSSASVSRSLIVIDQSRKDWRQLAVSAPADAEVLVLERSEDGLSQINDHLLQQRVEGGAPYSNLAIVCQGKGGQLQLGDRALGEEELASYRKQLGQWRDSFAAGAEIGVFDGIVDESNETHAVHDALSGLIGTKVVDGDETVTGGVIESWAEAKTEPGNPKGDGKSASSGDESIPEHFTTIGEENLVTLEAFASWKEALKQATTLLSELPEREDFTKIIEETFGSAGTERATFESRVEDVATALGTKGLKLTIELRSSTDLNGAQAAYAAEGPDGSERIYVNTEWAKKGISSALLALVLIEESGHAIDRRLNNERDSEGDEGAIFAKRVVQPESNSGADRAYKEDDSGVLQLDGRKISVEYAATNVSLIFDRGYVGTIGNNTQKNINPASFSELGIERITFRQDDSDADGLFNVQGNDVPGTAVITTDTGNKYEIDCAIVWNDKQGSNYKSFGLVFADNGYNGNDTVSISSSQGTTVLKLGSATQTTEGKGQNAVTVPGDTNVSLVVLDIEDPYTSGTDITGNAAGVVNNLNSYLDQTIQVSTVSGNSPEEGENIIFTITLDGTTSSGTNYIYSISSNGSQDLSAATFSNNVTYNSADETITVPGGVSSFTVTISTTEDTLVESNETVTLEVGNATGTSTILDDDTAPVVTANQSINYEENQSAGVILGSVTANDADGSSITDFRFDNPGGTPGTTSTDGYFTINSSGQISITANGIAAGVAQNDFETGSNSFTYSIQASDGTNWGSATDVTLNLTDIDDNTPVITADQSFSYTEGQLENAVVATVSASDADTNTGASPTAFRFANSGGTPGTTSTDGYFTINSSGQISITANGIAAGVAQNDFETGSNSFTYAIQASSDGSNFGDAVNVSLAITNEDELAPAFSSGATASIAENAGSGQLVYTAAATNRDTTDVANPAVTYSLKPNNSDDAASFSINSSTGAVTLTGDPNYESKASYSFTVLATDQDGNQAEQTVTLSVTNEDELAPAFSSGATASIAENAGSGQLVYTAAATNRDTTDVANPAVTYSLKPNNSDDAASFSINSSTGAVTLTGDPNYESKASYSFTVLATDQDGNQAEQTVTLSVTNEDELAPAFSSGATASIAENAGSGQLVYTAAATNRDTTDVANPAVTYSLKPNNSDDAASFSINSSTGAVTLTGDPNYESKASYSFTVLATDQDGNQAEQTVTLSVTNEDELAPAFSSGATASIAENAGSGQLVYTAAATNRDTTDVANPAVTYSLKPNNSDDAASFSINSSTGAVTLTGDPNYESKASYSFTVLATDQDGNQAEQTVTLSVTNEDELAPAFSSGATASIAENAGSGQLVYTAAATNRDTTDVANPAVTYSLKPNNSDDAASFSINSSTGAVTLTGDPNYESKASYSFTVLATDQDGNQAEQTVTLSVTNEDELAPAFSSGATASIAENAGSGQLVYTAAATNRDTTDVANPAVTYSLKPNNSDDAASFSINSSTGAVTLTGDPNYESKASYSFTVLATDQDGNQAEQTVTLSVTNEDELAPAFSSGATASIAENAGSGQLVYTAAATNRDTTDVANPAVTYSLKPNNSDDAASFSINSSTGAVTLTGDPNYESKASYSFTVLATDQDGNQAEQTVTLSVTNEDELAPAFSSGATASIAENAGSGQLVYTAAATNRDTTDVANPAVTYSLKPNNSDDAASFSINSSTGAVTLTGDPNYESKASYSFTVLATDQDGNQAEQTVTLSVTNEDELAPAFSSGATASIAENAGSGQLVYTAAATNRDTTDVANPAVTYSLKPNNSDDAASFSINSSTGAVTLTGDPNYESKASYSFTVLATDQDGNQAEQTVTLSVTNEDELAPAFSSGATASIAENAGSGQLVYTAAATNRDTTDVANPAVTYSLKPNNSDDAASFSINSSTGAVTLTGDPNYESKASYSFTVLATDQDGNQAEQTVTLSVTNEDELAPAFSSGATASIAENAGSGQLVYTAAATNRDTTDVANPAVTYSLKPNNSDDAASFSINSSTGAVTLTGDPNYESKASYSFTVLATDQDGNQAEQTVTLSVTNEDELAPAFSSGATASIAENAGSGQLVYTAAATNRDTTDVANPAVTYSLKPNNSDDAASFSINSSTGAVTLTGDPNYESKASYSFTVLATDQDGNQAEQTVTLSVTNEDELAPAFSSGATASIAENAGSGQLVYTAAATNRDTTDVANPAVTYSLKPNNSDDAASFSINSSTGAVTLTGDPNYESKASYSFTVLATDQDGNQAEQTVTLSVTNANDAPVANNDTVAVTENAASTETNLITSNDADADADTLSITKVTVGSTTTTLAELTTESSGTYSGYYAISGQDGSTIYIKASGEMIYLQGGAENSSESFSYTLSDGTATDTATVTLNVSNANDAPLANNDTVAVTEGAASNVTNLITSNDTDADTGDTLSITQVTVGSTTTTLAELTTESSGTYSGYYAISGQDGSTIYIKASGEMIYLQGGAENSSESFSYTLSDGTATDTATVTLNVSNANDAPLANNDTVAVTEGAASNVTNLITSNDTDADTGDTLSITQVTVGSTTTTLAELTTESSGTYSGYYAISGQDGSTIYIKASGEMIYLQGGAENSSESFSYTLSDGTATDTATVTLNVSNANDAPLANNDTVAVTEGAASNVTNLITSNDTDADTGDTLSITKVTVGSTTTTLADLTTESSGTYSGYYAISGQDGSTIYIKASGEMIYLQGGAENSSESFSYTLSDGTATDTATVTLNIAEVPKEVDDTQTIQEGETTSNLNVLNNERYSGDNASLSVYSVGGIVFASLTDSTDSTYNSTNGYKQIEGTYGTLYMKSTGESYYVHDGGEDAGHIDTFTYISTNGTNLDTSSEGTIKVGIAGTQLIIGAANNLLESDKDGDGTVENSERPQGVEGGNIVFRASIRDIDNSETLATMSQDTKVIFAITYNPGGGLRAADAEDIEAANLEVFDSNWGEITQNTDGSYTLSAGESDLFIKIAVNDNSPDEPTEYLVLSATTDNPTIRTSDQSIGSIDEDSDLDRIAPETEDYLQNLLSTIGITDGDNYADAEQNQITPLAWKTKEDYNKALSQNIEDASTLITIEAIDIATLDDTGNNRYQLIAPEVLDESDLAKLDNIEGKPTLESLKGLTSTGTEITTKWDALSFSLTFNSAYKDEAVASLPEGIAIIKINTSLTGATTSDFNGYAKYVSPEAYNYAVNNGLELKTPDGKAVTGAGWWAFNYNETSGIGAKFVTDSDKKIIGIELYLKDQSVFDGDINDETIRDPGIPYYLVASAAAPAPAPVPAPTATEEPTSAADNSSTPQEEQNPSNSPTTKQPISKETPDFKQLTVETETEQAGILEIASINTTNESIQSSGDSNRYIEETSLMEEIQKESFNSLVEWADSSGLISTTENITNEPEEKTSTTTTERGDVSVEAPRPLAFVAEALKEAPGTSSKLLETLVLGGGLLYTLNRASGNRGSDWIKRLLPATPGMFLVGGVYERVITVFRAEDKQGLDRVVAAKITDERIEILAEQQLPMDLEAAAAAKNNIDIQQHLEDLATKVTNEAGQKRDLLLYDPYLKNELEIYEDLGEKNDELKPQKLHQILSQLNEMEIRELENWLKAPSKSKNNVNPVRNHLQRRQSQLRKILSHEKSVLVSILELSLAMNPRVVI